MAQKTSVKANGYA